MIDKDSLNPPAKEVIADLMDDGNRIAVMVTWCINDGIRRHSADWDIDKFTRETCLKYFQKLWDDSSHS